MTARFLISFFKKTVEVYFIGKQVYYQIFELYAFDFIQSQYAFFSKVHRTRKLSWAPSLSHAVVRATLPSWQGDIVATALQTAILLQFNDAATERLTVENLVDTLLCSDTSTAGEAKQAADRLQAVDIHRKTRGETKASDHIPIVGTFAL